MSGRWSGRSEDSLEYHRSYGAWKTAAQTTLIERHSWEYQELFYQAMRQVAEEVYGSPDVQVIKAERDRARSRARTAIRRAHHDEYLQIMRAMGFRFRGPHTRWGKVEPRDKAREDAA